MSIIFFGDSITEGSNSDKKFTDYFNEAVVNKGVSGTTIGEYSIYPVDGYSLLRLYDCPEIRMADKIVLEYGINDTSAIMCDFVDTNKVLLNFIKVLDGIKQCNPHADIIFLALSGDMDIVYKYAKLQCEYLSNDYFKKFSFNFPATSWCNTYIELIKLIKETVKVVPMITDYRFFDYNAECMSDDNVHPNEKGHYLISETIKKYI